MTDVQVLVAESDLRAQIARILDSFPQLAGLSHDSFCCDGCGVERVRERWGDVAADAWNGLINARWLLGED